MEKIDLTKKHKDYFKADTKPAIVEIGSHNYLQICGKGDPSSESFAADIQALYSLAYGLKPAYKPRDFVVSKLEGLWFFDETKYAGLSIENSSVVVPRSEWEYKLMIMMPDFVEKNTVEKYKEWISQKKGIERVKAVEFVTITEGLCVQMMHIGPFATEPESLKLIRDFCQSENLGKNGLHHEIYLSDFRKTAPDKLKTILREPVKRLTI
ncbi:MAG: GyrI-like domain-containing protein [Bacteroidetes bacterium]|nr:GyrI-like domain-containing protein [Bacteroidota bacterium]